jgi:hypothetical protein
MTIYFSEILFNPIRQCYNRETRTRKFIAVDTTYLKKVGRNLDRNKFVASQSGGSLPYNSLKRQINRFTNKVTWWVLKHSDEAKISVCSLRNSELKATNAGYIQNSTANARLS